MQKPTEQSIDIAAVIRELTLVCSVQQRLIATDTQLTERLLERLSAHGIRDGFVSRAERAIARLAEQGISIP